MSMEIDVFFRGKLPSKPALAKAMKELGFPVTIPSKDSLERQSGFLPMRLRREEAGAEFDVFEGRANIAEIMGNDVIEVDPGFDRCASFRWSSNENEMVTAICASATLAKLVGGVVLDCASGELMQVDAAIASAKEHLDQWVGEKDAEAAKPKSQRPRGTSPSDLKRYLKPLLKKRDDLVLVGRYLVIRPVRHIVRGALLDYSSKDLFRVWCYLNPLYAPAGLNYSEYMHVANCRVWESHFEELLMDGLAEDVFARAGSITTLSDFATGHFDRGHSEPQLISFALDGEWDRAAAYFEQTQKDETSSDSLKKHIREEWKRISGNIEAVCAEAHAKEAEEIKKRKLEHIWEPSPFPVEMPAAERAHVNEPAFSPTPWIERPSWLYAEMPEQPRDIRFGKSMHRRNDREFFVERLTRTDAEKRHDASEPYVRAERLSDGSLLQIHYGGRDMNDPERRKYPDHRPPYRHLLRVEGLTLRNVRAGVARL